MCNTAVDIQRLETYREAMGLYKIKQLADMETFLIRNDISNQEKIETLYIIYESYNSVLNYIEERIDKIKTDTFI